MYSELSKCSIRNMQSYYLSPKKTGLLVPSVKRWVVSRLPGFLVCVHKGLATLTVCCSIISSAPSKDSAGWLQQAKPPGRGLGWREQLSFRAQGISMRLEHSLLATPNHSPSFHLYKKSSGNFLSKNGSWEDVFLVEMFVGPLEKPCCLVD